jgi:hypothetical protein
MHLPKDKFRPVRDTFESRTDVDAIAHKIAVALDDDIVQMNPDAELDTPVRRDLALDLAQRTASTALPNSIRLPSPVVLMRRPPLR